MENIIYPEEFKEAAIDRRLKLEFGPVVVVMLEAMTAAEIEDKLDINKLTRLMADIEGEN